MLATIVMSGMAACSDEASATSFRREAVDATTANPFMDGVDTDPAGEVLGEPVSDATTTSSIPAPAVTVAEGGSTTFAGDTPGLYGGSRNAAVCDATKMAAFLDEHPEEAAAWAGVLGIETEGIDDFISRLTATVLRADTAVTNHGFEDGTATAIPAVLQAGTAVFVDDRGEPVVKCSCGNPLTAPPSRQDAAYTGDSWDGFSARSVTSVTPSREPVNDITLVDDGDDTAFTRPTGTDGDADVPYYPGPEDVAEGGDSEPGDTTSDTSPDTTAVTDSTEPTDTTPTDTTPGSGTTPGSDAPIEMNSTVKGTSGECVGDPPAPIVAQFGGGRITFPAIPGTSGPVAADGTFDFTTTNSPPEAPGTTAVYRYTGRVDPPNFTVTIDMTIESPIGRVYTCQVRTPEIAPSTTTTTPAPTTTLEPIRPEEPSLDVTQPLEQTWYFESRFISQSAGCDRLGISFADGPPQRIRVRDVIGEGRTVTFLGRPSRTFDVAEDGSFVGQLIAAGQGDPDQMEINVGGGPVPSIGEDATPFSYSQGTGAQAVPGTFSRTACFFDYRAEPI